MTKSELANKLRTEINDESLIAWAVTCADCGCLRISVSRAVALASEVDTLDE
jgi:hypothetical protein